MSQHIAGRPLGRNRARRPPPTMRPTASAVRLDPAARLRNGQAALRARLARRDLLLDVLRQTHASLDPQRVAEFLATWAPRFLPLRGWAVVAVEPGREPVMVAERGLGELTQAAHATAAWILASGQEFFSADLARDPRVPNRPAATVAGFPLHARAETVGALVGLDPAPSSAPPRLSRAVLESWRTLLEPAALALQNALQMQRAEALSVTDDLTRLYNSRFLNLSLRREAKRAVRSGKPLSLLFIDLDGFKAVNDTYGHLHGSRALVEAAAVIRGSARETDMVARFGGDEFAVILPETFGEGATAVAERIRERIAAHRFLAGEMLDIRLTVSVGQATLPDVASSAEELVQAADRAMYRVKMQGKNGIAIASE